MNMPNFASRHHIMRASRWAGVSVAFVAACSALLLAGVSAAIADHGKMATINEVVRRMRFMGWI